MDKSEDAMGMDPTSPDFAKFLETFTKAIDEFCKLDTPRVTKRTFSNNPWITEGVILSVLHKAKLYEDWKKTCKENLPEGNPQLYENYSEYRKCLKGVIKTAKSDFYRKKIVEHKDDHKKTWEVINQIRGKNKGTIKPPFVINNERIIERRVIAQEFNKYFASIASTMNKCLSHMGEVAIQPLQSFQQFLPKSNPNSMFLYECTSGEVSKIIKEFENGKSSDIPIKIIKRANMLISPVIAHHLNYFMKIGKFPDELKIGKITPIYKKDNVELLENYRPISTLPIFGKIFEKIIYERLYSFFVSQQLLHEKQFGFRKSHSTSHAINYSVHHISQARKNNEHVLGIFIDLSKAFDTIDHKTLLSKLNTYGVRGPTHSLITSYLSGRKQYVSVLGESSDYLEVKYGVPQGSCLGPLLFLIYINDLCNVSKNGEFVLFADDTNIFVKAKNKDMAYSTANEILRKVDLYMSVNKLHINMKKCCYMHFKPESNNSTLDPPGQKLEIKISNETITQVSETKFLGIIIDDKLTWDSHIKNLSRKLSSATGILNRIKDNIPSELHKSLYHTLFESHLSYGITAWGGVSDTKLKPLFKVQKKCIRILFGDKEKFLNKFKTCCRARPLGHQKLEKEHFEKEHTKPLFKKHKLMTVHNLYVYHCSMEVFKILKFRDPISMHGLFDLSQRKETLLMTPNPNSQFVYKASSIWNTSRQLLENNDFSYSISTLKSSLKDHILKIQKNGNEIEWNNQKEQFIFF